MDVVAKSHVSERSYRRKNQSYESCSHIYDPKRFYKVFWVFHPVFQGHHDANAFKRVQRGSKEEGEIRKISDLGNLL